MRLHELKTLKTSVQSRTYVQDDTGLTAGHGSQIGTADQLEHAGSVLMSTNSREDSRAVLSVIPLIEAISNVKRLRRYPVNIGGLDWDLSKMAKLTGQHTWTCCSAGI